MKKLSYVSHVPEHLNSSGEKAPWVIKDHKTHKIISSRQLPKAKAFGLSGDIQRKS